MNLEKCEKTNSGIIETLISEFVWVTGIITKNHRTADLRVQV
jgi:hypothetical protein